MKTRDKDVLKEPVHVAIVRPTHVQALSERLPSGGVVRTAPPAPKLPQAEKKRPPSRFQGLNMKASTNLVKQANKKTRLRVLHDNYPPIPKDKEPACARGECKASPCCYAFVVPITKAEYESGLYDDVAVKITPEQARQLQGGALLPIAMTTPIVFSEALKQTQYVLEGRVGEPCPFLQNDGRCGIYEDRPFTCRAYTCVGDDRITQDMRDGKTPPLSGVLAALAKNDTHD